jgi:hypothetical protein
MNLRRKYNTQTEKQSIITANGKRQTLTTFSPEQENMIEAKSEQMRANQIVTRKHDPVKEIKQPTLSQDTKNRLNNPPFNK